ncbi:lytic transglycosylase domain-containing protein [Aquifex pyrophilus]
MLSLLLLVGGCTPKTKEVVFRENYVVLKKGSFGLTEEDLYFVRVKARILHANSVKRREVEEALNYWLSRKESLTYAFYRMKKYEKYIVSVLRRFGLPEELKYLPIVESMYNPFAVSRSGAAGIWQLMPFTARRYGLRVERHYDERFDPLRSTVAAVRYLRDLYEEFGNLELVLAAYNCGEGCVRRKARGSFWSSKNNLPEETRNYVPLFLALLHVAKNPDRYGIHVPKNAQTLQRVKVKTTLPVKTFIKIYGLKESVFRDLNPHIKGELIPKGAYVYIEEKYVAERNPLLHTGGR